jgi:hypothetical protein
MLSCMEGFECSVLLEGVSYQFIQDIEESISKCSAFLAANLLKEDVIGVGRRGIGQGGCRLVGGKK